MIQLDITGRNFEVEDKLHEYIEEKLGGLDKYLPRRDRPTTYCAVVLSDDPGGREDNRYVCDVRLTVRGEPLVSREGTVNMYAAVDIVEAKLKVQLVKYKQKHTIRWRRTRMLSRLIGRTSEADPETRDAPAPEAQTPEQEVI